MDPENFSFRWDRSSLFKNRQRLESLTRIGNHSWHGFIYIVVIRLGIKILEFNMQICYDLFSSDLT